MKTDFKLINEWEKTTNDLCNHFILKYFGKDADTHWIADDVGGVLYVNDHFFCLEDIVDFLKYKYSSKKMFEYMEYKVSNDDQVTLNIKNYKYENKRVLQKKCSKQL